MQEESDLSHRLRPMGAASLVLFPDTHFCIKNPSPHGDGERIPFGFRNVIAGFDLGFVGVVSECDCGGFTLFGVGVAAWSTSAERLLAMVKSSCRLAKGQFRFDTLSRVKVVNPKPNVVRWLFCQRPYVYGPLEAQACGKGPQMEPRNPTDDIEEPLANFPMQYSWSEVVFLNGQ